MLHCFLAFSAYVYIHTYVPKYACSVHLEMVEMQVITIQ